MATVANFSDRFPEFCDEDDSRIQTFLDDAARLMGSPARWLNLYEVAHQYHAAHLLTVANYTRDGDGNTLAPLKKQEVDEVVIHSAVKEIVPTAEDILSTAYGKQYYQYRKICFMGPVGT